MASRCVVLGGGMTGLAAALSAGVPLYEARQGPGGICTSYYLVPGDPQRLTQPRRDAYRFEYGGGHWIFGGDPAVLALIQELTPLRTYARHSAVYFSTAGRFAPFPLQYHLSALGPAVATKALEEMAASTGQEAATLRDWLYDRFGPTLCEQFFGPFHERYTAGLWTTIAPQDDYKTPVKMPEVLAGLRGESRPAGYNGTFVYPEAGLSGLAAALAARTAITYGKEVVRIDVGRHLVEFRDGTSVGYDRLISTLPLCQMAALTGLELGSADPHTSVLVLNLGARKGPRCPTEHWLYLPDTQAGFHRVGFYSNVETHFLPEDSAGRRRADRVSLYVEFAYRGGQRPTREAVEALSAATIRELQAWQFITDVEVADPTWIEVAYTWMLPGSRWRSTAPAHLEAAGIYQVGRYGRWVFQGIADSLRDGLMVGAALRALST